MVDMNTIRQIRILADFYSDIKNTSGGVVMDGLWDKYPKAASMAGLRNWSDFWFQAEGHEEINAMMIEVWSTFAGFYYSFHAEWALKYGEGDNTTPVCAWCKTQVNGRSVQLVVKSDDGDLCQNCVACEHGGMLNTNCDECIQSSMEYVFSE